MCALSFFLAAIAAASQAQASEVVLRSFTGGTVTNLMRNGGFALTNAAGFANWSAAPQGFRVAVGGGRTSSLALLCEAPTASGWRGASQTLTLNRTNIAPLQIRGWSRAENLTGSADSDYSLYVDIVYQDGTPLWGQTGNFQCGTHDWELQEFTVIPQKPVREITLHCLLRGGHAGKAWFDDVSVEEPRATGAALLFQGSVMELVPATNAPPAASSFVATEDGLRLDLSGQRIVSVQLDGQEVTGPVAGGFLARDIGSKSDVLLFENGSCAELGLRLDASITSRTNHIVIEGRVQDTTGRDRAVMLLFALPIDASDWQWHDDLRQVQRVQGSAEFAQLASVRCGTTGTMSIYPLAALTRGATGLGLAIDPSQPSLYRLAYHAGTRQFFVACDLGLTTDTERFPSAAEFRFVVFRFDAAWGFRAAWEKFQRIFPDCFLVRSRSQGIWMPFTDIATVQGWQDFGFRYQEGAVNIPFDDQHDILSFRYTEPMTWWMSMATNIPRTLANAIQVRDTLAAGPAGSDQRMATISKSAAMFDASGSPALLFRNEPWANGAVWSLNPNPLLPASPNAATVHWNDAIKTQLYSNTPPAGQDGEYLDSLEGYVTAEFNQRREHFRWTTVPLSFTSDTRQPALLKGLAVYEFTRWISDDVHRLGRLMFANGVPYRFGFLCPWLDVMGTETDWLSGGAYQPSSHSQMAYWRTLAGAKPYLLLMNTDFDAFAPHVERYFQRALFYGFYPSMFSFNAAENPYWRNPTWYNRDRALFKKYQPIIRAVAEAGWAPVTAASCDNPHLWLERFGNDARAVHHYTILNDSPDSQTGVLVEEASADAGTNSVATELLTGAFLPREGGGWRVTVGSQATVAVRLEPGPSFQSVQVTPDDQVRLTVDSPLRLPQVPESAPDLNAWEPRLTNSPPASPYVVQLPSSSTARAEYFRLQY